MIQRFPFALRRTKPHFATVGNYTLYYGYPTRQALEQWKAHDLAIIEPHDLSREQAAAVRSAGTRLAGYLSVMETPRWNRLRFERLAETDYYFVSGGGKLHFAEWDSYLMDLSSEHYVSLLLEEICQQIVEKGLDGIFLDTVGDLEEHVREPDRQAAMMHGYLTLLRRIKERHPQLGIIQNRGFTAAAEGYPWLDGLLWEDWDGNWRGNDWMIANVRKVRRLQRQGLRIFTLSAGADDIHQREANKLGFLHLAKPNGYNVV
ncbi:hypothetical protein BG53_01830 [Paenibacillus darwinianus]|uniref:Glycoside-hydrolase family GH114 TIM-barrel domain-containing protein n=1 Tax=Paenibacillus darwinianus TaxID=1380763 RepID=A0A9W5W735_9BACL|nr:endo alpha-1,4 polygalactosaminidase [Paenibacillus darwinianus]EXX84798.1 hypothetical protein BG52_09870 [Paenibacillus darwinianus]EXX88503.1 hypothetical protein BG53_01830 [Paenibacillus darwinianus]EXX88651.1 hypothetical protein CH50_02960 [Paenibacillus darwinianus]